MTTYLKRRSNSGVYIRMNLGMLEATFPLQKKKKKKFYIVQLLVIRTLT